MAALTPTADTLSTLLRLLDDDTPEVRTSLSEALEVFGGDVSELLAQTANPPRGEDLKLLSSLLRPARRRRLRREWIVPSNGVNGLDDDWDRVESLLRMISDYLHDGVTVRQPLGDALDFLAEENEPRLLATGPRELCQYMLRGQPLRCEPKTDLRPEQLDLAAAATGAISCPLGEGLVLLLTLRRLNVDLEGLSLPGTFYIRVEEDGESLILDPEQGGRIISEEDFEHRIRRYPQEIRAFCRRAATPGELLTRVTEELAMAYSFRGDAEDGDLMEELVESLIPTPQ